MSLKLQQALETLYGLERRRDKLGLSGTRMLLAALGDPHARFRSIHVAGTNGKGSVCAMIERALRGSGVRTGLYTSPHLVDFRERIRVDGRWALDSALEASLDRIQTLPESHERTFFEVATALAFDHFARARVEWAVVEVGLGGRLDSTNVITPELCVITRVSIDHAEILGAGLTAIAAEKAGIIKHGVPVVTSPQHPEVIEVIRRAAADRGAPLIEAEAAAVNRPLRLNLKGVHQRDNLGVAVAALEALGARGLAMPRSAISRGVRAARWPGRLERCPHVRRLWWDGAHNVEAFEALIASWRAMEEPLPVLVLALSRDKDPVAIGALLRAAFGGTPVVATRTRNVRAMPVETLAAGLAVAGFAPAEAPDVPAAIRTALALRPARPVLLAGSLFAVGEAMQAFGGAPGEWL